MSLSKITHHMWEVVLFGAGGGGGIEQNLKRGGVRISPLTKTI